MTRHRLTQLLAIVLLFAVAGPLVGLLAAALAGGTAAAFGSDLRGGAAVTAFMLVYGLLFAHLVGALPALLAGVLVAGWAFVRGRVPLAGGAAVGLLAAIPGGYLKPLQLATRVGDMQFSESLGLGIMMFAHVVAAVVCTRLTRRWQ